MRLEAAMQKTFLSRLLSFVICLSCFSLFAQKPTIQDCLGAIPICTEVYEEADSPTGDGNYHNEINGSHIGGTSCMAAELNSIWYTFTVNNSGDFGFVLTPNDPHDDYDWALFDITYAHCQDIFSLSSLEVSCNAAGSSISDNFLCNGPTGANGKSFYSTQGGGCGLLPPTYLTGFSPFNDYIPVVKGNTYVLVVSNWTGSKNGYKIDFSASGDLGIFDNQAPEIIDFTPPTDCQVDQFELEFSENIQLISLGSDNFMLEGPDGIHEVLVTSNAHTVEGDYDKSFSLRFVPPITQAGTYHLAVLANGSTDFLDLCGNPLPHPANFDFEITRIPLLPPDLGTDTVLCEGSSLQFDITDPGAISYLWSDSTTSPLKSISSDGIYTATIRNECGEVSQSVSIQLANCNPCQVFVPNAFTPNGDGINDVLQVFSDCNLQEFSLTIFDRWGGIIHRSESMEHAWDGHITGDPAQNGVYSYLLNYRAQELGDIFFRTISGDVAIIR
jgi:gliding motility-associated-like protein